ncbi:MAG: alkaline phosphatase [Victivallaceae bacterium]|nr:alkaline phosphatase [Victivallaceae bacterium]
MRYIGMAADTMGPDCRKDSAESIHRKAKAAGLELTDEERQALPRACEVQDVKQRGYAVMAVIHGAVNKRAGIGWSSHGHTSDDVHLFAGGPCAVMFAGSQENSDVGIKLKGFFTPAKWGRAFPASAFKLPDVCPAMKPDSRRNCSQKA